MTTRLHPAPWLLALLLAFPAAPAAAQEIKLKLSHFVPPSHNHHTSVIVPWVEEVKKRTNGRVEITIFPGASLCKPPQQYECVRDGIADISFAVTGWTPGRFPASSVVELPFMMRTAATGSQMLADLWDKYLKGEYGDVHLLYMNVHPAGHIHTHSKHHPRAGGLQGPEAARPHRGGGRRARDAGRGQGRHARQPDLRVHVQQGVDGFVVPYEVFPPFKFYEVTRFHTEVGMYTTAFAIMMNKAKYESCPPTCARCSTRPPRRRPATGGRWASRGTRPRCSAARSSRTGRTRSSWCPRRSGGSWREALSGLDDKWAAGRRGQGRPRQRAAQGGACARQKYGEAD